MEEENKKERKRNKDRSLSPDVKSTAVVKYTAFGSPVSYARLQCNTDLNMPPTNWAAIDSYGLKQILTKGSGFSSFQMANMFPDCVGDVDVISGGECIKKLLKLPYQPHGTISMMVHRVENTLLLDEFNIHDSLLKTKWAWFNEFFYEQVAKTMNEMERMALMLPPPSPSTAVQLTHKFLSHSVAEPAELKNILEVPSSTPVCISGPYLPEPEPRAEQSPNEHFYNRNVLWTFEDIHMLIGSDLPIFGDKDRPCVSLRLRDAREPINVLTGIDYWLDNLMCNVPEVLMCYHLDGIVQKYEPMKTEDLPNMENSKFSPKIIRNVAQNILSFLKSNVTKAGHTYWLFKGPHDDVVKLYDLTSLCPDSVDNPFTTPVAMLLYRVARNIRLMSRDGAAGAGGAGGAADAEDAGARSRLVRRLLEHAVALLPADRHPHIVASARYMLADGYLPAATDPARPVFHDDCEDENEGCKEHVAEDNGTECGASGSDDIVGQNEDNKDYLKGKSTEKEKEDSIPRERSEDNTVPSTSKGTVGKESLNENTSEQNADRAQNVSEQDISENMSKEDVLALQVRGLALHDIGDRIQDTRTGQKPKTKSGKGLTLDLPDRCTKALSYALEGLKVLHNVTLSKSMEEERERLKQQIINEEQHPKMANPFEPIKMDYQPLNKQKAKGKENKSKNKKRRNKKSQETEERSENFLLESKAAKDLNAILVLKDENVIPSLQEPNRDDSFAWKLHLKTLLYEKICLAYATLAEYSYTQGKYGYSLKYIDMASRCQTLLSNMIIKSKVVDVSCLIGRVGDNYLQLSKNLDRLEKFKAQLETDLEIDKKIKLEIEIDLVEECEGVDIVDEFEINVDLYESETETLARAVREYRRAGGREQRAAELRRRLACALNELGVRHMHDGHDTYTLQYAVLRDKETTEAKLLWRQVENSSRKCEECLQEAFEIFEEEKDMPNLALLCCNKARYLRFKAHCLETLSAAGMRGLYTEAERLYQRALKYLGPRDSCGAATIWDLVNWELSSHLYNRAVYMYDYPEGVTVHDISTAFKHALKNCLLSPGPKQYLYQFRAAMIHYKLGSLYKTQYRMGKDEGGRRRATCVAACEQYEQAAHAFAALEDCAMHLTVRLEHADLLEAQARLSPNLILKSLQDAIQVLSQCQSVIKLIKDREPEEQPAKLEERQDDGPRRDYLLLEEFRNRLHLILQNIIRYCASKSNKDYDKLTATYKDLYRISLTIKQNDDVRKYAESIYNVLQAMSSISMDS